jgi:uncharacterized protein
MHSFIVFDTSVLISAALNKSSLSRKAYDHALTIGLIVRSTETLTEFASRIVKPKFDKYLTMEEKLFAIANFKLVSTQVNVPWSVKACRDPNDDMFLSLALAVNATCIVTKDKDLLTLHPFRGIPILTPAGFLKEFKNL